MVCCMLLRSSRVTYPGDVICSNRMFCYACVQKCLAEATSEVNRLELELRLQQSAKNDTIDRLHARCGELESQLSMSTQQIADVQEVIVIAVLLRFRCVCNICSWF